MISANEPQWAAQKEGRTFARLPVTTMLNGAELAIPLHVITGRNPGPTFGVITNTHGDYFLATIAIREFIQKLDTATLNGQIVLVSVAKPMATAGFGRLTLEVRGRTVGLE